MKNSIVEKTYELCSGCSGCTTVCPVNAISCEVNKNGFYTASVNDELCISCGKCKKVCIKFLNKVDMGIDLKKGTLYSMVSSSSNTVDTCTSGGIGYEILKYGLKNEYIVSGVVYDYSNHTAKSIIINEKNMEEVKGSKYLQAINEECFREIINIAKKNRNAKFMIFGTPCQILGLKKSFILNNLTNELICIDLFCHGTPSYLLWENYISTIEKKYHIRDIEKIFFRSKHTGWHNFTMEIHSKDKSYIKSSEYDIFYKAFFDNILINSACQKCEVRKNKSIADIRLGDFWGKRYQDNESGVSAVLALTDIGNELINKLANENQTKILDEIVVNECLSGQSIHDYKVLELHKSAIQDLKEGKNISKVIKNYRRKMPIKYRIKVNLKESTAYLPRKWRSKLRNWYRKKVAKGCNNE